MYEIFFCAENGKEKNNNTIINIRVVFEKFIDLVNNRYQFEVNCICLQIEEIATLQDIEQIIERRNKKTKRGRRRKKYYISCIECEFIRMNKRIIKNKTSEEKLYWSLFESKRRREKKISNFLFVRVFHVHGSHSRSILHIYTHRNARKTAIQN